MVEQEEPLVLRLELQESLVPMSVRRSLELMWEPQE
jgi:hypothetical protein